MRTAAIAAALSLWLATPLGAQEHTSRWELTESFIRGMWLHPVRAMDVTVLGPGPVHVPETDCEIHIGAELGDATISDFANLVLEPPNVCKDGRKSSKAAWRAFYNTASNRDCVAEGSSGSGPSTCPAGSSPRTLTTSWNSTRCGASCAVSRFRSTHGSSLRRMATLGTKQPARFRRSPGPSGFSFAGRRIPTATR
jgi:hypothetical protein